MAFVPRSAPPSPPSYPPHALGADDVHRVHRWRIVQIAGVTDSLFVYAKTLTLPEVSFDEDYGPGASVDYKFPSKAIFSDVELSFYDLHGLYAKLDAAYKRIWSPDTGLMAANNYMAESIFTQHDGQKKKTNTFKLVNSYIKKLSHSPLTYDASDLKVVNVTIGYSWAEFS